MTPKSGATFLRRKSAPRAVNLLTDITGLSLGEMVALAESGRWVESSARKACVGRLGKKVVSSERQGAAGRTTAGAAWSWIDGLDALDLTGARAQDPYMVAKKLEVTVQSMNTRIYELRRKVAAEAELLELVTKRAENLQRRPRHTAAA